MQKQGLVDFILLSLGNNKNPQLTRVVHCQ